MKEGSYRKEEDLVVGYTNVAPDGKVYHSLIFRLAVAVGLSCGIILGIMAFLIADGVLPLSYFGQFSASSNAVATSVGAGIGLALGGLAGGLWGMAIMLKNDNAAQPDQQDKC